MNKKAIIIIGIATFGLLGLMGWGYAQMSGPTVKQLNQKSALALSESLYDFGTVSMAKGKVNHLFQLTNPTDAPVTISQLETSCMCTNAYIVNGNDRMGPFGMPGMGGMNTANQTIPARGTMDIDVVFDPAAHGPAGIGNIDRFIYATQADGGTAQFEIKAVVIP